MKLKPALTAPRASAGILDGGLIPLLRSCSCSPQQLIHRAAPTLACLPACLPATAILWDLRSFNSPTAESVIFHVCCQHVTFRMAGGGLRTCFYLLPYSFLQMKEMLINNRNKLHCGYTVTIFVWSGSWVFVLCQPELFSQTRHNIKSVDIVDV